MKLTVTRSGTTVVTGRGTLKKGKLELVLKPRHTLRKGRYTLKIALMRAKRTTTQQLTFKVE